MMCWIAHVNLETLSFSCFYYILIFTISSKRNNKQINKQKQQKKTRAKYKNKTTEEYGEWKDKNDK